MGKVGVEVFFDLKKNVFLSVLLVIQLVVYFSVCILYRQIKDEISLTQETVTHETQEIHYNYLTDNLVDDYFTDFFSHEDALGKLKVMYALLADNSQFDYLEMYCNPIGIIGDGVKDEVLDLYESGEGERNRIEIDGRIYNEVKCYWISCNVGEAFDIQCQWGQLWTEEEKNSEILPVVLGSEYTGIYQIGDYIEGRSPLSGEIRLKVYGILKKGEYLIHRDRIVNLDRYIMIPLQDARKLPESKEEEVAQIWTYIFKINGTLSSTLSADELQDMVQEICDASGVFPSSKVSNATNAQSYIVHDSITRLLGVYERMLLMLNVFSLCATVIYILIKIDKNRKYYGILMLNGFSVKQVFAVLFTAIVLLLIIAETLAMAGCYLLTFFIRGTFNFPIMELITSNMELLLIVAICGLIKIRRLDISACIAETV